MKTRIPSSFAWTLGIVLLFVVASVIHIARGGAQQFDDAIVALFGTVIGTAIGVPVGLYVDRYKQSAERADRLLVLESVLREELVHNGTGLIQLADALARSTSARSDIWQLARIIVDSFETETYREWLQLSIIQPRAKSFDSVSLAYRSLVRIRHRVQQAGAWHAFHFGHSADEQAANQQLDDVRTAVRMLRIQVQHALEDLPQGNGARSGSPNPADWEPA